MAEIFWDITAAKQADHPFSPKSGELMVEIYARRDAVKTEPVSPLHQVLQHLRRLRTGRKALGGQDAAACAVHNAVLHGPAQGVRSVAADLSGVAEV